jgi:hypothetical protein
MRNVSKKTKMNLPYGPYQHIKELHVTHDNRFTLHLLREASDGANFKTNREKENKLIDSSHTYTDNRTDSKKRAAMNSFHCVG